MVEKTTVIKAGAGIAPVLPYVFIAGLGYVALKSLKGDEEGGIFGGGFGGVGLPNVLEDAVEALTKKVTDTTNIFVESAADVGEDVVKGGKEVVKAPFLISSSFVGGAGDELFRTVGLGSMIPTSAGVVATAPLGVAAPVGGAGFVASKKTIEYLSGRKIDEPFTKEGSRKTLAMSMLPKYTPEQKVALQSAPFLALGMQKKKKEEKVVSKYPTIYAGRR